MSAAEGGRRAALASLALGPGAGDEDIRMAYRRLALRFHPDASRDPKTAKRFTKVVRAYKVLAAAGSARGGGGTRFRIVQESGTSRAGELFDLGQILAAGHDAGERAWAARALGLSGRSAAYVFLRRALYDPVEDVVLEAVRAVALLGSRQAEGEVAALYSRASAPLKARILELAAATGERLFRSTLAAARQAPGGTV